MLDPKTSLVGSSKQNTKTPAKTKKGGQVTISPPANVNPRSLSKPKILASNIDTLYLAIDVKWKNQNLFEYLSLIKSFVKDEEQERPVVLFSENREEEWYCPIMPYGIKGYEWFLKGLDYTLMIGNWMEPQSKPGILAQIGSEILWALGPENAVERLLSFLKGSGAEIECVKPSRVDLCVDIILPDTIWNMELINYRVTRASYASPYFFNNKLTGISIGKGKISARLYDKPLEIKQKSKKTWLFDIWGIDTVPEDQKIIRVEFQLRREAIKELGLNNIRDLFECIDNIWAYCAQKWLKFQDNPGKHHTQRNTFEWWKTVQNGFPRSKDAYPLIRSKACRAIMKQLTAQAKGLLTSLQALRFEEQGRELSEPVELKDIIATIFGKLSKSETNESLTEEIIKKRAKYHRSVIKNIDVNKQRIDQGFPVGGFRPKKRPSP